MTHNKLTCLFGHHDYSEELTKDKHGDSVYLCRVCKRSGYDFYDRIRVYHDYDEEGNKVHSRWDNGKNEFWYVYDEKGNRIYSKFNEEETWMDYDDAGNCHVKWDNGRGYKAEWDIPRNRLNGRGNKNGQNGKVIGGVGGLGGS